MRMASTIRTQYPPNATSAQVRAIDALRRQEEKRNSEFLSSLPKGIVGKEAIDAYFRRTPLLGC